MTTAIRWRSRAAKEVERLDADTRARIAAALRRYAATREGDVRKLVDVTPVQWRLRVGDYRVRFTLGGDTLEVLHVLPRDRAYR